MTSFDTEFRCLAIRRVNPFLGVLQLVLTQQARAVSQDGYHWEIQVYAERPADLWGGQSTQPAKGLFRFGVWRAEAGLAKVPMNPILNTGAIIPAARRLVSILERVHGQTPFPLLDGLECWLLDVDQLPLALIATALPEAKGFEQQTPSAWSAAPEAIPVGLKGFVAGLERRIAEAAGEPARHHWIQRTSDGSGRGLKPGSAPLPPEAFPETLFRDPKPQRGPETEAYLSWLAPRLLTLPTLSDATRGRLEHLARPHALELAALWRLYPKIVHPELITSARVEAGIRLATPKPGRPQ